MAVSSDVPGDRWRSGALPERTGYEPQWPIERWMVPLLGHAIEERLRQYAAPLARGGRCLDVGCGGQPFRPHLERMGFAYTGFDVHQNPQGTVEVLGAIDEPLPPALHGRLFNFILCTEVLEHVARWPEAFHNLAALLAPGGRLLLTTPHLWFPHEEPADFFRPTPWAFDFHGRTAALTPLEITRLGDGRDVLGTVLSSVRIRPEGGRWFYRPFVIPLRLLRSILLRVLRARGTRRYVSFETSLYLSTIAVFEKR
ncbi:MAG TPA: class I SAM-dependent methyltransferase [Steroidobacteraceae bacterium]|nr:class I SAM-dependent methyltransferase [Steroidobacteraceae bacterium]